MSLIRFRARREVLMLALMMHNALSATAFLAPSGSSHLFAPLRSRGLHLHSVNEFLARPMRRPPAARAAQLKALFPPLADAYNAIAIGISGAIRLSEIIRRRSTGLHAIRASPTSSGCPPLEERDVLRWLKASGIDVDKWGKGSAKRPSDLLQEVVNGESVLSNGKRIVHVVKVAIRDGDYELVEARQVFINKKNKVKEHKERNQVLAEKFRPTEEPIAAALRGIREELAGVVGDEPVIRLLSKNVECFVEESTSNSFPGLISQYQLYSVQLECKGLTRERTGMRFLTGEPGWNGKLHVWEWRKVSSKSSGGSVGAGRREVEPERELAGRVGARYF